MPAVATERSIDLDTSRFPLVVVTLRGKVRREDLDYMMRGFERLMAGNDRYFNVIVQERGTDVDAVMRKALAEWQRRHERRIREINLGTAIVLTNAFFRGALTALNWLSPPPTPQLVCATREEAIAHGITVLRAAGLEPGPTR